MVITTEQLDKVRAAFANPKYTWRTIKGVAVETDLTPEVVREAIRSLGVDVIPSSIPSESGEELFTVANRKSDAIPTPDDWTAVRSAMENPKYTWRTLKGIATEKGIPEAKVMELIQVNRDIILQSEVPSADGEDLYTTRQHFINQAGPVGKMLSFYHGRLA